MSRILIIDDDIHIGNMLEELLARITVALRRSERPAGSFLTYGSLRLDQTARLLFQLRPRPGRCAGGAAV